MDGGERSGYWKGRDVEKYQRAKSVACLGRPRHMIWHPDDDPYRRFSPRALQVKPRLLKDRISLRQ